MIIVCQPVHFTIIIILIYPVAVNYWYMHFCILKPHHIKLHVGYAMLGQTSSDLHV